LACIYNKCSSVGLPVAIAEAQASGVGVCIHDLPGRTKSFQDYVGEAGYVYKNLDELPELLRNGFSEEKRKLGYENAKKSDIERHRYLLENLWHGYYENFLKI